MAVCAELAIKGVGTHRFRRMALTTVKARNIPLNNIASISDHESLDELAQYLEVLGLDRSGPIADRHERLVPVEFESSLVQFLKITLSNLDQEADQSACIQLALEL